jgi:hypothetical protein
MVGTLGRINHPCETMRCHGTQPREGGPLAELWGHGVDWCHCQWGLYADLSVVEPESGNRVRTGICSVHDRQEQSDIYSAMRPPMTCVCRYKG